MAERLALLPRIQEVQGLDSEPGCHERRFTLFFRVATVKSRGSALNEVFHVLSNSLFINHTVIIRHYIA